MLVSSKTNELLGSLGPSLEVIGREVGQLGERSLDRLNALRKAYGIPGASLTKFEAEADRVSDLPPFGSNREPREALLSLRPFVESTYYRPSVKPHPTAGDPLPALLDRHARRAQILVMAIRRRDDVRQALERTAVGKVAPDGRNDGTVTIQIESPKEQRAVSPMTDRIEAMADAVPPEILERFAAIQLSQTAFGPFGWATSGMSGGFEASLGIGQSDPFADTGSLDEGVLRLKRMIDKRTQAMELYSQTLTTYNTSAKGIIEKMRA